MHARHASRFSADERTDSVDLPVGSQATIYTSRAYGRGPSRRLRSQQTVQLQRVRRPYDSAVAESCLYASGI